MFVHGQCLLRSQRRVDLVTVFQKLLDLLIDALFVHLLVLVSFWVLFVQCCFYLRKKEIELLQQLRLLPVLLLELANRPLILTLTILELLAETSFSDT